MKALLAAFLLVSAIHADEEVAIVLKNDEKYTLDDLYSFKKEFIQAFHKLFKNQNNELSTILQQNQNDLLSEISSSIKGQSQHLSALLHRSKEEILNEISMLPQSHVERLNVEAKATPPQQQMYAEPVENTPMKKRDDLIGVSLFGDFLYWAAYEDGLEFALTGVAPSNAPPGQSTQPIPRGQMYRPDFEFSPGFRIGGSYEAEYWGIDAEWTSLESNADRNVFSHPPGVVAGLLTTDLWGVWSPPDAGYGAVNFANAQWKLNYNMADLMLNISLHPAKRLNVRPGFGFMYAGINQKFNIQYGAGLDTDKASFRIKNNFSGGGFRAAVDASWDMGNYVSFFSRMAGGLVFGRFGLYNTYNSSHAGDFLYGNPFLHVTDNPWSMKPELDFCMGLSGAFPVGKTRIKLSAAWDFVLWFDQNQMMKFYGPDTVISGSFNQPYRGHFNTQHGDLFFQGLTVSGAIEF